MEHQESLIAPFLSGLKATIDTAKEYQKINEQKLALRFNPLTQFFRLNENKFSKILAFFLDAEETHGQGRTFIDLFLKKSNLELKVGTYKTVYVRTEQPTTEGRRIDLYLDFDNRRYGIAIENKIWARDQRDQLEDYNTFMEGHFREGHCLIYMPPFRREVDELTLSVITRKRLEEEEKFFCFDHSSQTIALIELWIQHCEADNVRVFLKQLHGFIQQEINRETVMGQKEMVANYLERHPQYLELALAVQPGVTELLSRVAGEINKQVLALADRKGFRTDRVDVNANRRFSGFTFIVDNGLGRELWIRYQFEAENLGEYYYGVLGGGEAKVQRNLVENELSIILGPSDDDGPTVWWSWWKWHSQRNDFAALFRSVYDGSFIQDVENILDDISAKVQPILNSDIPID
jgi:hypothetical protein